MPDPILILIALVLSAASAAAVPLVFSWPWRGTQGARSAVGGLLGVALGIGAGTWWLGQTPHWPPREDQDRLLLIVVPAVVAVEIFAALFRGAAWHALAWIMRLVVAAGAAPVLLYNTVYLADLAGPGTREWSTSQMWIILAGLAAALAGEWALLARLAQRTRSRTIPLGIAVAAGGAAITIMLSGYATGGQMGLSFAAAMAGAAIVSPLAASGLMGIGVVGLFALLIIGRFFGDLTTLGAMVLFAAPMLCWLCELPYIHRWKPWLLAPLRLGLVAIPVVIVLILAQRQFVRDSGRASPDVKEPSIEDYMRFGK